MRYHSLGEFANQSPSLAPAVGDAVPEHRFALGPVPHAFAPSRSGFLAQLVAARFQFPETIREDRQLAHLFFDAD